MEELQEQPPAKNLRILVVDDDPFILQEIALHLMGDGYLVETAESAAQALKKMDVFHPEIVLTDWVMNGMDGLELCQVLRQRKNGQLLYIILLTSHDAEDSLVKAFEAGVDDYIPKPLTPRILLARVQAGARLVRLQIEVEQARREQAENARMAQQIQRAHKMQAIGKLTGGIAHNFNNYLAAILGYAELAREMFAGVGDGQLDEFLENIQQAGSEARDLVASLRSFSSGDSNSCKMPLIGVMLDDIVRMLQPVMTASTVLKTNFGQEIPLVMVNQDQIYQMVMSLCINAREAMNGKGEICLHLRHVREIQASCTSCHEWLNDDFVELSVHDSGRGIDTETLQRVFDPFFSNKEVGRSTGLGLSVVHGIMHGCGGHILVDSEIGKGSHFHLLFPVIPLMADNAEANPAGVE
ncbi:MAG TPA: hybrid sensor histidine kinase/response regulator [Gammaproteobacteria bacterium]|nr:hybrid sensor histidine kinase/response regulator [Gammaproteobacteria bacterium]